jgi:hypothetical protein
VALVSGYYSGIGMVMVTFLVSLASDYIHGTILSADIGWRGRQFFLLNEQINWK